MVTPIELDDVDLVGRTIIDQSFGVGPGAYIVRDGDDAVTYSVEPVYLWITHGGKGVCSNCKSMNDRYHETSPGTSGSVHDGCRCQVVKRFRITEIGRIQGGDCALCNRFFATSDMKGGYCLDCVEVVKENYKDLSWYSFWVALSLGACSFVLLLSPATVVIGGGVGLTALAAYGVDRFAARAADDPPDESYKESVELMEVDLDLEPTDEEVSNLHIMEAVKATINVIANLDAHRRSMEKFTYAAGVFDRKYISLQGTSVIKFEEGVITSLQEQIESFQTFGSTLKDTKFDIELKPENINELQAKLEAEGFNEQQLNVLQKLGLDTDAINQLKEKIINADPGEYVGKLSDLLNTFVTKMETFKDKMMSIGH